MLRKLCQHDLVVIAEVDKEFGDVDSVHSSLKVC